MEMHPWYSPIASILAIVSGLWAVWWKIDGKIEKVSKDADDKEAKASMSTSKIYEEINIIKRDYVRRDDLQAQLSDLKGDVHALGDKVDSLTTGVLQSFNKAIEALARSKPSGD